MNYILENIMNNFIFYLIDFHAFKNFFGKHFIFMHKNYLFILEISE